MGYLPSPNKSIQSSMIRTLSCKRISNFLVFQMTDSSFPLMALGFPTGLQGFEGLVLYDLKVYL